MPKQDDIEQILRIGKDTLFYGGTNVMARAVSLALLPFYTRFFVPAEYGVMELLMTVSAIVPRLLSVGMDSALLRFYNDYDVDERRESAFTVAVYFACIGIPVALLLSTFSEQWSGLLFGSHKYSSLVVIMLLAVPFTMIGWVPQDLTRLRFKKLEYNFLMVGGALFYAVAAVILVLFFQQGLYGVMWGHLLRAVLFAFLGIILVRSSFTVRLDWKKLAEFVKFGAPLLPASIALWVSNSSDRFFLARLASLDSVGVYSVATRLASVQWFVLTSFQLAFTPIAYAVYREPSAESLFRRVFMYYVTLSSILGIVLSVFALNLLRILTPQSYHSGYNVVGLLNLGVIMHGVFYMFGIGLSIAKRTEYFAYSYVLGALANLALNLLLIPRFGVVGAATATLVSFALTAVCGFYWSKVSYPLHFPISRLVVLCGLFLISYLLAVFIDSSLGGNILLKSCIAGIYVALTLLLLHGEERILLVDMARGIIKRGWVIWKS